VVKAGDSKGEHLIGKKVSFYMFFMPNSWSNYAIVNLSSLMEVPSHLSPEQGACAYLNPLTVLGLVDEVKKGNHKAVVITTASACSKMLFKLFKEDDIKTIAIVRRSDQERICLDNGATIVLNSTDSNFEDNLKRSTIEYNATCCIDCIMGYFLEKILRNMPYQSEIIFYGDLAGGNVTLQTNLWLTSGITIRSYVYFYWFIKLSDERKQEMFAKIISNLDCIFKTDVQANYKLEELNEAYNFYLVNMSAGKVIINIE